ncbi:MAG: hypothetical protein NZM11_07930 [Anaerolineales bacterium]|nr:hypothetical protein [Anaerolineales bacterium]
MPLFAMIGHGSACCRGIRVARLGRRCEALEPVRQAVREPFGGISEGLALGGKLHHDHGSQFLSDDLQHEIRFPGMESSLVFVPKPEGNGWIEHFFRTLKKHLLRVRYFDTLEELAGALEEFRPRCNEQSLIEGLGLPSPRQAHPPLLALEAAA